MPQTCSVCLRPRTELAAIDKALIEAEPLRNVAKRTGLSLTSLFRHKAAHLPQKLQLAKQHEEIESGKTLLEHSRAILSDVLAVAEQARSEGKTELFLKSARTAREFLELEAKLQGQLQQPTSSGPAQITVIYSERTLVGESQSHDMVDVTPRPAVAKALAKPAAADNIQGEDQ